MVFEVLHEVWLLFELLIRALKLKRISLPSQQGQPDAPEGAAGG